MQTTIFRSTIPNNILQLAYNDIALSTSMMTTMTSLHCDITAFLPTKKRLKSLEIQITKTNKMTRNQEDKKTQTKKNTTKKTSV